MTPASVRRSLIAIAAGLERQPVLHKSGRGKRFGECDDPEGTLLVELSVTVARRIARVCRDIAEAVDP